MQAILLGNGVRIFTVSQVKQFGNTSKVHSQYQLYFRTKHKLSARSHNRQEYLQHPLPKKPHRTIITKYIHGWILPITGDCRKYIHGGDPLCPPDCSVTETNEHLLLCKHKKIEYSRTNPFTSIMRSTMGNYKVGKNISRVWLDYLSHPLKNLGQPFNLCRTLHYAEDQINSSKAIRHQEHLGFKQTPRGGYLTKQWCNVSARELYCEW